MVILALGERRCGASPPLDGGGDTIEVAMVVLCCMRLLKSGAYVGGGLLAL